MEMDGRSQRERWDDWAYPPGCFRVAAHGLSDTPRGASRCPVPVTHWGVFKDSRGVTHEVQSCLDHFQDLVQWRPV